ncbi:MAG: DUF4176 domain-containing protein [Clostridiales bacterium]|nr:DUF4176 domain-containing protein [Clostridiales bacterium]
MKIEGLLPVGSVVMLKEGTHRVMIIGYCQRLVNEPEKLYDYVGCLFPEGFLNAERNFLFNREQIDQVFHFGYQSEGQMAYVEKIENAILKLRQE